jgi:uncharacterized membrane protein
MDDLAIVRALHVLAVVVWIGGVAMVTTIILPAVRDLSNGADLVEAVERRFAVQARIATLLAGASGFYMVDRLEIWDRFRAASYWWMHAMVGVWLVFTVILFVAEPLFLHRWFEARARVKPEDTLKLVARLHWALLIVSLITIFAAVAGSHGLFLF